MKMLRELAATALVFALAACAHGPVSGRQAVLEAFANALEKDYVFPAIGKRYAWALRAKAASAEYAAGDDFAFAEKVSSDLERVHPDKHLRLLAPLPPAGSGGPRIIRGPGPGPGERAIERAERLTPDIAYIRFSLFPGDSQTMQDLEAFLAANAGVRSLIVDVRGHRGGGVDEIDVLFADLFTASVDLVQMETTKAVIAAQPDMLISGRTFRPVPSEDGRVRMQHFVVPSDAPRLAGTKLYVLQSGFSGSAAEHFLLEVKMSKRGRLVGETSAGAAHFGFPKDLGAGYSAFIPAGRTFDPVSGWDWEGVGVTPDVVTRPERAFAAALEEIGVAAADAETLDARIGFVMPRRGPGGGPVIVHRASPPG
jgi:hypothetical protein